MDQLSALNTHIESIMEKIEIHILLINLVTMPDVSRIMSFVARF